MPSLQLQTQLKAHVWRYAPLFAIAMVLIWHSLQYNFVTDDAYISFVFSDNLAEHGQLVFNHDQQPVEGYTNFLWTFGLGILMIIGLPPEIMSLVFGAVFAVGTLWLTVRILEHIAGRKSLLDFFAAALLAVSSGFACWTSGGLETQMFTFWVTLAFYAYVRADGETRYFRLLGISLALAAMTRPEGLLITALIGGHRFLLNLLRDKRLKPNRPELVCLGAFLLIWAPWFAWRAWYYGHLFPNTYYVKAAGDALPGYDEKMHANGQHYIMQWLRQSKLLYGGPVALLALAIAKPRSRRFVFGSLVVLVSAVYIVYTIRVGGDFMGLHRFVMPLFVIGAIGVALALRLLTEFIPQEKLRLSAGLGLGLLVFALFASSQWSLTKESAGYRKWKADNGIDTPSYLAVYAHDRKLIGEQMRECFVEDDFSIFGGVGAKPYHAKTRGIDVFGLVSEKIAHEVKRTRPRAGHNKWGPDKLLYETYKPSFVFHCYSLHTSETNARFNCSGSYWTRKGYKKVTMHVPGLVERGEYYSFFVAGDRVESFVNSCSGVVK
ncbi:MAG: hypothetical protein JKY56_06785 [Kofleriaceae bacterium]|nr:hypothetical protein [Kofleriaceae bacterium]